MLLRDALQQRLTDALRQRDRATAAALRNALGALANAEAVPVLAGPGSTPATASEHIAGGAAGLGAAEAQRRLLTEDQQRAIVAQEHAELRSHVERLRQQCRPDDADAARRAAETLEAVLAEAQRSQR